MRFADLNIVDIYAVLEPPIYIYQYTFQTGMSESSRSVELGGVHTSFTDLDVVSAHLSLPHLPVLRKSPVFETVASLPLHSIVRILIFIPDPVSGEGTAKELFETHQNWTAILSSVKAKSSFRRR